MKKGYKIQKGPCGEKENSLSQREKGDLEEPEKALVAWGQTPSEREKDVTFTQLFAVWIIT